MDSDIHNFVLDNNSGGGLKIYLQYLGKHTLYIVIFHFLAFKIVNFAYMECFHLPSYTIAAFPVLTETGCWWIVYTLLGISVPLAIEKMVDFTKAQLFKRGENNG